MSVKTIPRAFGGTLFINVTPPAALSAPTKIQALARDGYVLARGKSGLVVAQSRDGAVAGKGR